MATEQLATWATNLQFSNLTAPVIAAAVASLYNWAGCAIGGFQQTAPQFALNATAPHFGGPAAATILGLSNNSVRTDAQIAAFINGIAGHVDDYDDTHLQTIIHPAGTVASALFAVAEWKGGVNGSEFLTAFVAGVEAELKLGLSVWPQHYDVGWHDTSTTGSIGAAVAVSKLWVSTYRLCNRQLESLLHRSSVCRYTLEAIQRVSMSDGKYESFSYSDPTLTESRLFRTRASQSGMLGALLAQSGFTSSLQGLEGQFGWVHVVSTRENVTAEFDNLGKTYEILSNTFKPYACGIVMHPAIQGAIEVQSAALGKNLSISDITKVEARVNPEVLVLTGQTDPQTGLEGKFSVFHGVAIGLLFADASPQQFTDAVVTNSTVVALRKLVNITTDPTVNTDEAFVSALFKDGTDVTQHIVHVIGSLDNPLSEAQLKTKFIGQAELVLGSDRAEKAYEAFTNIGNMSDVSTLAQLFSGANDTANTSSSASSSSSSSGALGLDKDRGRDWFYL
ncbi:hypothetical protein D9757_010953 [Collybiopsis confluens]|uniref:Uncharacterized protein n=1 Tax=Collybiopsis confluens TaxID=2823264 RepID=A0A8H5LQY2_9AGAR|nr:hypothetical protein D9757_010953 [Collybiopsis confluens]